MKEFIEIVQEGEYMGENPATMEDETTAVEMLEDAAQEIKEDE